MEDWKKNIVNTIQRISGKHSPYQIFRDWVELFALATQNACDVLDINGLKDKREQQYLNIIHRYDAEEVQALTDMCGMFIYLLEQKGFGDWLGSIYMESGCGSKYTGQFFTPYHLSVAAAQSGMDWDKIDRGEHYSLYEPSCGGGGMIIAAADAMNQKGYDYQKIMHVTAQDLDWIGVYMTYIQLSYYGIDAVVVQGDTLAEPYSDGYPPERVFRTPRNMGVIL